MLNFEFHSAPMSTEALVAMIFAVMIFMVVPVMLAVIEYRVTKNDKKHGFYLMIGTFASALLLGWYSLLVGLLVGIVYWISSSRCSVTKAAA